MTNKFIKKYMRLAKAVADDQNPCLSRAIGAIIVNPEKNLVVSTGYNGPAAGVPHPDTYEFLHDYVYPQLRDKDKNYIEADYRGKVNACASNPDNFADVFNGCKICPRRLVGAISGERLGLCGCAHAEANAVNNAAKAGTSTFNCFIFCWCSVPCVDCTNSIINSGIRKVYCLESKDEPINTYNDGGNAWRMRKSGIEIVELVEDWILED